MKRCPVAMAIGANEGGWFPGAYAWDGNGRGLWQVNYATAQLPGDCAYHPKEGEIPEPSFTGEDGQVHNCDLYDPIKEATLVIKYTSNGKDFNPPGKCWSTCSKKCANGAPGYDGIGGPKLAEEAQDSCTAAIHSITKNSATVLLPIPHGPAILTIRTHSSAEVVGASVFAIKDGSLCLS